MQKVIVGIDEAGRGPLAGPVVAAAFTLLQNIKPQSSKLKQVSNHKFQTLQTNFNPLVLLEPWNLKLRDSKVLSAKQRELIYAELLEDSQVMWGTGAVSEKQIDKLNIFQATRLAMKKAVLALERKLRKSERILLLHNSYDRTNHVTMPIINSLIVDGNMVLDLPMRQTAVIKADATVMQCMAAGIVAKVTRDRLMLRLHKKYPVYGFARHKGYGTAFHLEMLKKYGSCPVHRQSFSPIRQMSTIA